MEDLGRAKSKRLRNAVIVSLTSNTLHTYTQELLPSSIGPGEQTLR